jgi:FG-GAP repeat
MFRSHRHRAFRALVLAALGTAVAQDQTWYQMEGSFVQTGDHWGSAVALVPDVNGDGCAEMLIGAPDDGSAGSARLVSGKAPHALLQLHTGEQAGWDLGAQVANAGLIDADAKADYLVSAPGVDTFTGFFVHNDAGMVTLYSGASGNVIRTFQGYDSDQFFGESLAGGSDVTGDGRPDILIGAPRAESSEKGYVRVYNGVTGAMLFHHEGDAVLGHFGAAVAFVGDLTGDGRSEYAIGAPDEWVPGSPITLQDAGVLRVYNGATHGLLYSRSGGFGDELGYSICAGGDTDGDGVRELLVGAPGDDFGVGRATVYEGSAGIVLRNYYGPGLGGEDRFGSSVANVGDIDKDGRNELAVGARLDDFGGGGCVTIFDGAHEFQTLYYAFGDGAGERSTLDGGRDVNADGWPDLLVGLPGSDIEASEGGSVLCTGQLTFQEVVGASGPHEPLFEIAGGWLKSGSIADLSLTNCPDGGSAFLLLSAVAGNAPFKGGTLVPALIPSLLVTFPFLPNGELYLTVPGGGGPLTLYAQFLVSGYASGAPLGLSNALAIELLP